MAQHDNLHHKMELAVQFIGDAEASEANGDLENAIKQYEEGAHLLSQAGFPHEKITELYNRISELKDQIRQQAVDAAMQSSEAAVQAEDHAFHLIDLAEEAIKASDVETAISHYETAMPLLEQAGYTIQHVQDKLQELRAKRPVVMKQAKPAGVMKPHPGMKPGAMVKPVKPAGVARPTIAVPGTSGPPPVMKAPPTPAPEVLPPVDESAVQKIDDFMASRGKVEELEAKAFALIDEARSLTEQEKFQESLHLYGIIKGLLQNAGWTDDQVEPVLVQEALVRELVDARLARAVPASDTPVMMAPVEPDVPTMVRHKIDLFLDQDTKMRQFKASQASRQSMESQAFDLITEAQQLYKHKDLNRDYPGAIRLYTDAVALLKQAGWLDQVPYLESEIDTLVALHAREVAEKKHLEAQSSLVAQQQAVKEEQAIQKQNIVEDNLKSISAMLGRIDKEQKVKEEETKVLTIKQQLIEEKRYKELISRTARSTSLDSLKDMLFGDKDSKVEAERKALKEQQEQEFLSSVSKRFYSLKKESKETSSLESMVDMVHSETLAARPEVTSRARFTDLREKQAREQQEEQKEKENAIGDVMSLLGSLKKKDTGSPAAAKGPGHAGPPDDLKAMFSKIKKDK